MKKKELELLRGYWPENLTIHRSMYESWYSLMQICNKIMEDLDGNGYFIIDRTFCRLVLNASDDILCKGNTLKKAIYKVIIKYLKRISPSIITQEEKDHKIFTQGQRDHKESFVPF